MIEANDIKLALPNFMTSNNTSHAIERTPSPRYVWSESDTQTLRSRRIGLEDISWRELQ